MADEMGADPTRGPSIETPFEPPVLAVVPPLPLVGFKVAELKVILRLMGMPVPVPRLATEVVVTEVRFKLIVAVIEAIEDVGEKTDEANPPARENSWE